jgi:hypothetical protein
VDKNNIDERFYNRNTLYTEVWNEPMLKVAKRYGVSDVALAKTCRKLNVPLPGVGYWTKKQFGKEPPTPPLPKMEQVPRVLKRSLSEHHHSKKENTDILLADKYPELYSLIVKEKSPDFTIDVNLESKLHPLIENTRKLLKQAFKDKHSSL